jgi:YidC/Oxa1 family membrane protein insertase
VDKRTIIAILLIALVFIVYTTIMKKKPEEQGDETKKQEQVVEDSVKEKKVTEETIKEEKEVKESKETEEAETEGKKIEVSEISSSEEKVINVHTNLYRAKFSTIGATLKSIQLLDYMGKEDKPVELIPEGERTLSLSIVGKDDIIDLSQFLTVCDKDSVKLKKGAKDSIIFYYTRNDTPFIKKVYVFYADSYTVDLKIEVLEDKPQSLNISFGSGLALTEEDERDELAYSGFVSMLGENYNKIKVGDVKKEKSTIEGLVKWAGVMSKYFLFFILPEDNVVESVSHWKIEEKRVAISVVTEKVEKVNFSLYFGPLDYYKLSDMGNGLENCVYFGWNFIAPIAKIIFYIFTGIHRVVPNYGVVIILFSTIMMIVFFPLTFRSHASMRKMQKLQPKMQAIREKYKDDPQKMNAEIMKMYSKNKVNPLGGCLPLLFQMPIFFALYAVLRSTIELRQAPFILWIQDLSMKDPYFILPILMGIAMFVQQKFTITDPRQKAMTYVMPIFLVFIFSRLPAGIVLYWFVYNLLSILQQYLIRRSEIKEEGEQEREQQREEE